MLNLFKSRMSRSAEKRDSGRRLTKIRRTSSEQMVAKDEDHVPAIQESPLVPYTRSRSNTFTNGVSHPVCTPSLSTSKSTSNVPPTDEKLMESLSQLTSPRHFQRRKAVFDDGISLPINNQADHHSILVRFEDGSRTTEDVAPISSTHTLRDVVEMVIIKHDIEQDNLDDLIISVSFQGSQNGNVSLDQPSIDFGGHTVELRPRAKAVIERWHSESMLPTQTYKTVSDCLSYFDSHGLVELPLPPRDDGNYHLPRVQPIDPIVKSWSELPIDPALREALSKKETGQQLAVWEFIATEHSHIRRLETIINVFMRCLELIRRTRLLSEESYHNVFGYMEDVYNAHDQFWTWTLEPALEKVYETGLPLELNEIISRFPKEFGTHFEIYEQHCQLEALNQNSLKKARENSNFAVYLEWCESQPECHRLGLDQLLAAPMQRLTRYPLLMSAIIKKTTQPNLKQRLEPLWEEMQEFVGCVNSGIRIQEETERVRDAMSRITGFQVVDVPHEIKELIQPHTHLDLLAPMAGVEVDRARVLMLEGTLKFRDGIFSKMVPLHMFLFTDMLLITKRDKELSSRKENKYTIIREPYKIDRLVLHPLEPGSFCAVVLNEFQVASTWFILKANSPTVATEWMDHINRAQRFYVEAVERRTQHWKLLQSLQGERILNGIGIEGMDALSASLWSISPSLMDLNRRSFTGSIDSLSLKRQSSPTFIPLLKKPLARTKSEEKTRRLMTRNCGLELVRIGSASSPLRTGSLDLLVEHPESPVKLRACQSQLQLMNSVPFKQDSEEYLSPSLLHIPTSPLSQDSGTESGGTISADVLDLPDEDVVDLSSEEIKSSMPLKSRSANSSVVSMPLKSRSANFSVVSMPSKLRSANCSVVSMPLKSLSANCSAVSLGVQSENLKPILRHRNSEEHARLDELKSILRRANTLQLNVPSKPINRVKSDDSGIAVKQGLSEPQGSSSPSPHGCPSIPDTMHPRPKMKVHFRSISDTSTLNFDITSPKCEEKTVLFNDLNDEAKPNDSELTSSIINDEFSRPILSDSSECTRPCSPKEYPQVFPDSNTQDKNSDSNNSVQPTPTQVVKSHSTAPSPKLSRPHPPPVTKKPLRRITAVEETPPQTKASDKKASPPVAPRKKHVGGGKLKPPSTRKKSVAETQGTCSLQKKKPSQLRKPSITTKDLGNVSVKEVKKRFESASEDKPPRCDKTMPKGSESQSKLIKPAIVIRKTSHALKPLPRPPVAHQRSRSIASPNDFSNFHRVGAVRAKASPPRTRAKKAVHAQKQSSLARSSSNTDSEEKISIGKTVKPASFDASEIERKSSQASPSHDEDMLSKLAALTPPRNRKLPRKVSGVESPDTQIRIEVVGGSERGIDIPLNFNSNNNKVSTAIETDSEPKRKDSVYDIQDAITVSSCKEGRSATLPHMNKRYPIEWNRFGFSWKSHGHSRTLYQPSRLSYQSTLLQ